jgi:uncharacterized protein YwqG
MLSVYIKFKKKKKKERKKEKKDALSVKISSIVDDNAVHQDPKTSFVHLSKTQLLSSHSVI